MATSHPPTTSEAAEKKPDSEAPLTFKSLGLADPLCKACSDLGWKKPTDIQREAIPFAVQGRDVIGLAETGSGKTAAFVLPMLHALLQNPQRLYGLILAPTRELAVQISEQIEALGGAIGVKSVVILGGVDMMTQAIALAKKPHIVIGTPGRIIDHLENTKGFSLRTIKHFVLDEADRMLGMDFEEEINKILQVLPRERHTALFSATMTSKVAKLQRASLHKPVKVEVSDKYTTVKTLVQQYLFMPAKYKDCYLAYVLNDFAGQIGLVFTATCAAAQRLALMLRNLGFSAVCLHGQMSQTKRLGALNKFKAGHRTILIATDVASRGLDIPSVDLVINFDIPSHGKDYIHRVGRTARAGRAGRAITFVTQYDVELYKRVEALIDKRLEAYPTEEDTVLVLLERVSEAQRYAAMQLRESGMSAPKRRRYGEGNGDGEEDEDGGGRAMQRLKKGGRGGGGRGRGRGGGGGRGGRGKGGKRRRR